MSRKAKSKQQARRRDRRAARRATAGRRAKYGQHVRAVMRALRHLPNIPLKGD